MSDSPDTLSPDNKSARWVVVVRKPNLSNTNPFLGPFLGKTPDTAVVRKSDWIQHGQTFPNTRWRYLACTATKKEAKALAALWLASQGGT